MKKISLFIIPIYLFLFFALSSNAQAANYYIDFESGNDTNSGNTKEAPWKHAPGDVNGPVRNLQSGDEIIFKGGVIYKGTIAIPNDGVIYSGNSWPGLEGSKAIIDGSENLVGEWEKCSLATCNNNPNFQNIYYIDIPSANLNNLYENNQMLWMSQSPNMPEPFFYDDEGSFRVLSSSGTMTLTSISDPQFFNQVAQNYWKESYVLVWRDFNVVEKKKILSYDPTINQITYSALELEPYDTLENKRYSVLNNLNLIDIPGEYFIDETNLKLYVWAHTNSIPGQITYSVRGPAFDLNGKNNISIEGFKIQKQIATQIREGEGISNLIYEDDPVTDLRKWYHDLIIRDNEISLGMSDIKYGGITPDYYQNILIENNYIHHNRGATGMQLALTTDGIVRDNIIDTVGSVGIWFMNAKRLVVKGNIIKNVRGNHTDAVCIYQNSEEIFFSGNKIFDSTIGVSNEASKNVTIANNIIDLGANQEIGIVLWGGTQSGYLNIINNVVLGTEKNKALSFPGKPTPEKDPLPNHPAITVKNNTLDGWSVDANDTSLFTVSNNIYTDLAWNQMEKYNWYLRSGEFIEKDLTKIFTDPINRNYHLKIDSLAKDVGINVSQYNVVNDIDGVARPQGSGWDIGAYEYASACNTKGDFTCNGFDATDIQTMINIILKIETTQSKIDQAKMNEGDTVDASDLQILINKVLGIN